MQNHFRVKKTLGRKILYIIVVYTIFTTRVRFIKDCGPFKKIK